MAAARRSPERSFSSIMPRRPRALQGDARCSAGGRRRRGRTGRAPPALPAAVSSAQVVAPLRADDEVGLGEARLHVVEEGDDLRLAPGRARRRPPPRPAWPRRSGGRCAGGPARAGAGSAATSAWLMMREPWLPPKASRVWGGACALRGRLAKPPRTGLPGDARPSRRTRAAPPRRSRRRCARTAAARGS